MPKAALPSELFLEEVRPSAAQPELDGPAASAPGSGSPFSGAAPWEHTEHAESAKGTPDPFRADALPGTLAPPGTDAGPGKYRDPEADAAALLLARVEAVLVYPEAARLRGTEGVVGLSVLLNGGGALSNLRIDYTSGSPLLDREARRAVEASLPVTNPSGRPLAFRLSVRFSLERGTPAR
ncbi:MAG TPA: energy transducer TonB [Magnetospirillaceae bacterium]|nr:energy transducer TonB [Magnetospirillaceae bacterium]